MGELHGRPHPDRPEQQPPPDDAPPHPGVEIRNTPGPRPAPGPADVLINPPTPRDRPEPAKRDTPDGPTHRPPDLIPPRGEDLAEKDAPGSSLGDRLRKRALERENLENIDAASQEIGDDAFSVLSKPRGPTHAHADVRHQPTMVETPHHGLDGGDTLSAVLFTGFIVGEGLRRTYRKMNELKEIRHAGNG